MEPTSKAVGSISGFQCAETLRSETPFGGCNRRIVIKRAYHALLRFKRAQFFINIINKKMAQEYLPKSVLLLRFVMFGKILILPCLHLHKRLYAFRCENHKGYVKTALTEEIRAVFRH